MDPIMITVLIAIVFAVSIAVFYPILMNVLELAPYAYTNAKIRAMEAGIIKEEKFSSLIASKNVIEGVSSLESTDYGTYVSKITEPITSEKVSIAIDQHYTDVYTKTINVVPEDMTRIFKKMSIIWDVQNIKNCLRLVKRNIPVEERNKFIVNLGNLSENTLKALVESKTIDEAVSEIEGTEYGKFISNELSEFRKTHKLLPLEVALDKLALRNSYRQVSSPRDTNMAIIKSLLGARIDLVNLKTILRGKAQKIDSKDLEGFIIPSYYQITKEKMNNLLKMESISEAMSHLEGTPYSKMINEALSDYKDGDSLLFVEKKIDESYLKTARGLSISYPLNIGPALGLLVSKENEMKKLKAVMLANEERIPEAEIKELIA